MSRLYDVTLTDLGTYQVTVAADTPEEAVQIAKEVLWEEATQCPAGLKIVKRETDAKLEPCPEQPIRRYRVRATYKLDFALTVPAATADEAAQHARRIYAVNCGPFEFDHEGDRVSPFVAELEDVS